MKTRVEIVKTLPLLRPEFSCDSRAAPVDVLKAVKWVPAEEFYFEQFNHFPIIVDQDGSGWNLANRYLLSKLDGITPPNHRTLDSIARDLAAYRQWSEDTAVDILNSKGRPGQRPTYRYARYLHDEVNRLNVAVRTAKRRIISVINFYRWLLGVGYRFENSLWEESKVLIGSEDRYGVRRRTSVTTTDISRSFKVSNIDETYSGLIKDGGNLRPLTSCEQELLVKSLLKTGNREMTLAFFFALSTGARMQTVFTLRLRHLDQEVYPETTSVKIKIGRGTGVDTKGGKQMVLQVPVWLYNRLKIYVTSPRYLTRLQRAPNVYPSDGDQYAFLTKAGRPYYMAENDPFVENYKTPPRGNAVNQYIAQQLQPFIDLGEDSFKCKFHDLRATFGMNIVRSSLDAKELTRVPSEDLPDYFDLMRYVASRMGHSNIRTTESYLKYGWDYSVASTLQEKYEAHLQEAYSRLGADDE